MFPLLASAYGIAVLVLLAWAARDHWTSGGFGSPELRINHVRPSIGDNLQVSLVLPTRFNGTVQWMTLRLRCEAKDTSWFDISGEDPDTLLFEQREYLFRGVSVQSRGSLDGRAEFSLPRQLPPSSPAAETSNMRIVWTLYLEGEGNLRRSIKSEYILDIAPSS
ncbi:MAG: hypothetical protein H8E66_13990 [Planctomycetes bacterium]|nr:hypothetical protein [Planctomycetota bacterium]